MTGSAHTFTLVDGPLRAVVTDLGARLLEFHVPDRDGLTADVVLGRPALADSQADHSYLGATVGRYGGRIAAGRFDLDGVTYQLATNEGSNHLHGGDRGFDGHLWDVEQESDATITFRRTSPDGEEGFPGTLDVRVTYALADATLAITMTATTDAPTVVRLVHHTYWNLGGHDSGTVLDHVLQLAAQRYVPLDDELLPTGELLAVDGTPYDFREPKALGRDYAAIVNSGAGRDFDGPAGYDDTWVLDGWSTAGGMRHVGSLSDPASGRRLDLDTDQAGVCVYMGGYLAGEPGKAPVATYPAFAGVTLETTGHPNDANIAHFPSPVLRPGEEYRHEMRLRFSTEG